MLPQTIENHKMTVLPAYVHRMSLQQ